MTPAQSALAALRVAEMYLADAAAVDAGTPGPVLMENAARAVANAICRRWSPRPTVVLAGPGSNGGDGWAVARLLDDAGWPVRMAMLGDRAALTGDAAHHAGLWRGPVEAARPSALQGAELIVDALFGAGLARPLAGPTLALVEAMAERQAPVVAVDLPSGVSGDTGQIMGGAAAAALTVTFFRKKPGHLLAPGRFLAGEIVVAEIGIPVTVAERATVFENGPGLWREVVARPTADGHKYTRGHLLVAGGAVATGAARLAARAGLRAGAGLVTIACPRSAWPIYAAAEMAVMTKPVDGAKGFQRMLDDERLSTVLLGPGLGVGEDARSMTAAAAAAGRQLALDADALTSFAEDPNALFAHIATAPAALMTPHMGEFRRLFPDLAAAEPWDKLVATQAAARRSGAVVLLKGPDTVVAAPDGMAAINTNAPATLATAGAGDVLVGIAGGLLAAGASPFVAAAAAAWLHGKAATDFGPGLIASDLLDAIPAALKAV